MANPQISADYSALQWLTEQGADEAVLNEPADRTVMPEIPKAPAATVQSAGRPSLNSGVSQNSNIAGAHELRQQAAGLAAECQTLDELKQAIADFDGLEVKKTATQIVFSDGNPKAKVMLVGEAPGADEDRQGKPFVGVSGQLLDKILACINLDRHNEDPETSAYISNILNWRPPGNRTPTEAEMAIALPFIERHVQLIKPEVLVLCGGVSAKTLLGSTQSISRLRGQFHNYKTITPQLSDNAITIDAVATYHPSYLLRTPSQKKLVWQDMLRLQQRLQS